MSLFVPELLQPFCQPKSDDIAKFLEQFWYFFCKSKSLFHTPCDPPVEAPGRRKLFFGIEPSQNMKTSPNSFGNSSTLSLDRFNLAPTAAPVKAPEGGKLVLPH